MATTSVRLLESGSNAWAVPDFLSPARVIALSEPSSETIVLPAATVTRLCIRSPRRVGLYVLVPAGLVGTLSISPFANPDVGGVNLVSQNSWFAAGLPDWLSLICGEWFGYCAGGATVVVGQSQRPARG